MPVRGKVTFRDSSPMPGGWVELQSIDGMGGNPRGPIQSDGTFVLGTFQEGDGARVGKYRVLVSPPGGINPGVPLSEQPPPVRIPKKYQSFKTSGIEFEVDPNQPENRLEITVERLAK